MSKVNIRLFYEVLARDKALQEKFQAVGKKYQGQQLDEADFDIIIQNEILQIANEAGLNFTLEQFKEYVQELNQSVDKELSDDELDAVAGGVKCTCGFAGGGDNSDGGTACFCLAAGYGFEDGSQVCGCPVIGTGGN